MTTKQAKVICPECGAKYNTAKGLSTHRRIVHGVAGSGKTVLAQRKKAALMLEKLPQPVPLVEAASLFKCQECGEVFPTPKDLGLHRKNKHNVRGIAPSTIATQKQREAYLANYKRDKTGLCICPECGKACKGSGITNHRKTMHNLSSEQQAQMFAENKTVAKIETVAETQAHPGQCPECEFVAINAHGLRKHISSKHHHYSPNPRAIYKRELRKKHIAQPTQAIAIAQTNGHIQPSSEEAHAAPSSYTIPEGTLALALGRFQGLCQSISTEFDLPPRMFATRLAELIYHTQVR